MILFYHDTFKLKKDRRRLLMRLKDKVIIVTGGARGMGASHVKKIAGEGAKVVITDILEEEGAQIAKDLGKNAMFIKQDVTDIADWKHVVEKTEETFGPVNVLVNNAGIDVPEQDLDNYSEDTYLK